MKTTTAFSREKIYNMILFSSIGFILGLISFYLIKLISIILVGFLAVVWWERNKNHKK